MNHWISVGVLMLLAGCASDPAVVGQIDTEGEVAFVSLTITNAHADSVDLRVFVDETLMIEGTPDARGSSHCWSTHALDVPLPLGSHEVRLESDVGTGPGPWPLQVERDNVFAWLALSPGHITFSHSDTFTVWCR
jgi:hypothetical protein